MDFVKFSLSGFDEFLIYAGLAIAFIYVYMMVYLWVTPYSELKLIKDGNVAAAISLSGSVLGVTFPLGGVGPNNRSFDEYFALAYNNALRSGDGSETDPIDAVRQKGALTTWDFAVDTFETVEEQGVVAQNILAAGALDYVFNLGERLGIFKLADALVLRWASGAFDAGRNILLGVADGVRAAVSAPYEAIKGALARARDLLPFSDAKEGPLANLSASGRALMDTLTPYQLSWP